MTRFYAKTARNAALSLSLALAALAPAQAAAERLAFENFNYSEGGLFNQGSWIHHSKNVNEPIQLLNTPLTYPGYQDEAAGLAAKLIGTDQSTAHERLQKEFFSNDESRLSGVLYMSALIKAESAPSGGDVYFMALCQRGAKADANFIEGKSGSEYARVFASPGDADGKFKLGISKNAANAEAKSADLDLNTTYLVVLKYEFIDGTNNDKVSLWVNPAKGDTDPAGALAANASKADASNTMGLQGVTLRQGSAGTKIGPDVLVDAIRLADTYADLWDGETGGETPTPPVTGDATITAPASLSFDTMLQHQSATKSIIVKGEQLAGPIAVSLPDGFTANTTSISAEEAEAGYTLELTFTASKAGAVSEALTLSTEGADDVSVALTADVLAVTPYARFNFFNNLSDGDERVFMFQGKGTVTYVDPTNQVFYAQDIYGAGCRFSYAYHEGACPVKAGDRISNFYALVMERQFDVVTMLLYPVDFTLVGENYTVEPLELSLSELSRDPETYINRLVKVSDLTFGKAGEQFATSGTPVSSGGASGSLRAFPGSDLIGTTIPATATSATGISTSASAAVVTMRSKADLEAAEEPGEEAAITATPTMLIDATEYQPIGKTVAFAKVKIDYKGLTRPAAIYITGANRAMFAADAEEVPAGSGSIEVNISYTPSSTGRHAAALLIDAMPTELSQTLPISARAYDPANMPSLTVSTEGLTPFSAQVGSTMEQTFSYTAKANLDYGTVRIVEPHAGQFQISTAQLMKEGTYHVKVTFAPKNTGTFTETIELSSDLCDPIRFTVTGTATGQPIVEDKQGDELTDASFDTSAARKLVVEDFEQCGVRNQPLSISGWTNAAVEGTRAWWAFNTDNDNFAAKVTAYDSQAADETDATMLLLSPALDYKNADERILTFRIMGDFLAEGATGFLQVVYIDPSDAATVESGNPLDKVYIEPIGGLNIPSTSDYNKEWIDYVLDLDGLELADAFFIGFSYSAPRGKNFPAVYYVDDFSWGRTDIPFIRTDLKELNYVNTAGTLESRMSVNVQGLNLGKEIAVSTVGAHASKFTPSHTTLPAEGGTVHIDFASTEIGLHEAYLKLSSEGAPDTYVTLSADTNYPSGITGVDAPALEIEGIYNLSGFRVASENLAPGVYIIRYSDGTTAKKVVR
ncbi:MAG: hypothetical protein NC418_09865 [Muribaculaceae bacterium]|nr:hypothetical protein [Muribaculaceae bacterium]